MPLAEGKRDNAVRSLTRRSLPVMRTSQRLATAMIDFRWPLLAWAGVLTLAAFWPASQLQFDRSIESIFPSDDPRLTSYLRLKETFGGNEIVLAVYEDPELFAEDGAGLERVTQIRESLAKVDGVKAVLGIDQPLGKAILEPTPDGVAARVREVFAGYTHSADGKTVSLACMLKPRGETETSRRETIAALRDVVQNQLPAPLSPGVLTGEPVMVSDGFRFVEADGRRLGWATTILLTLVIIACFRSLRWVIIPIAIVQATLLWTRATLVISRLQLSMVSSMLTAVVTVIGIATVVHVIVRFRAARDGGRSPRDALTHALALLLLPIIWACCTDAAGFAALLVTDVGPVRDFGVMMAIGALLVIVAVVLLLPTLALLEMLGRDPQRAWGEKLLDDELGRLVRWVELHPLWVAGGALPLVVICALGTRWLEIESDFTKNFRADSQVVQSYTFVEDRLGGAGVWDIVLPAPERLDAAYLKRVARLEERLNREVHVVNAQGERVPGLTKTLSLADAVAATNPSLLDEDSIMPDVLRRIGIRVALRGMRESIPEFYDALYAEDAKTESEYLFRIMLRSREQQSSAAKRQTIEQVERIVAEEFPARDGRRAEVTGFFVLLTFLINNLLADQWLALGVACAGIGLMMLIAFRDVRYGLVALVPNVLPILMVTGLMGWLGLRINMGAAMIASVSMGLSIDSSIHYITAFQRARREGKTVHAALETCHHSVGRALVFATVALIAGFSVLCFSEFIPTIYFGALVSLTMLGGLAGNLILLPLLLKLVTPEQSDF